jgi:hypothetical protein
MALVNLPLPQDAIELPTDVRALLCEADRRIERFQRDCRVPGFVPSDFVGAYRLLHSLAEADLAPGNLFCEWGSGFGVVTCLAALLDFDAHGIEIEGDLVDAARRLAADFQLPVEFQCGSFIPRGSNVGRGNEPEFSWLCTDVSRSEDAWGLGPADFDVIFAFPWPDEEKVIPALFDRHAARGAVLATYHDSGSFQLRRKVK